MIAAFDLVVVAKTAAVVLVTATFIAICVRALRASKEEVSHNANLPLDDPSTPSNRI